LNLHLGAEELHLLREKCPILSVMLLALSSLTWVLCCSHINIPKNFRLNINQCLIPGVGLMLSFYDVRSASKSEMVVCGQCDSSDSPAGWIAFMQCYNMPRQVLKKERAQRVKILEEAESIAKGDDTKQLLTLIEPQNLDSGVPNFRGGSLDYYPTEHVACCGHQVNVSIHICGGGRGLL
jgi:hypothetical protein